MSTTRRDKRQNNATRPIQISYGGLARVDGSARFAFGETNVLASLSGPIEVRLAAELPAKATLEVLVRPLANVPGTESKSLAATIRGSLEPSLILTKNPRSLVQLVIQSLTPSRTNTWSSGLAAAMINASSLALLNAGSVPMRGVVAAVAVGRTSGDVLVVDPSDDESEKLKAVGCFAFLFADRIGLGKSNVDCVWSSWRAASGGYDERELFEAKLLAQSGAQMVYKTMRRTLTHHTKPETAVEVDEESENAAESGSNDTSDDEEMVI